MQYLLVLLIIPLSILALIEYEGQGYIFVLFTIVANYMLYFGFREKAIFFDMFIAIFLWLGFWLKLSARVAFMDGEFSQAVGAFDGSGDEFDQVLLITVCGMLGFLLASIIRERLMFVYPNKLDTVSFKGLYNFYLAYRKLILLSFAVLIVAVAISNVYFGFYQRGAVPRTVLPFGLNGVYTWLLLFGLASITAILLHFELENKKQPPYMLTFLGLMEAFLSNVSLLSRGMVLNVSALGLGLYKHLKLSMIPLKFKFIAISMMLFLVLFVTSVLGVNYLRGVDIASPARSLSSIDEVLKQNNKEKLGILFLDRWVGVEGVMAVSSYNQLGWDLWGEAWNESFTHETTTFYDLNIIDTPYKNVDSSRNHYISLPGIIAFCFYPGSFLFLFSAIVALGLFGSLVEMSAYYLGGKNVILCALLSQVVAYRFAHFGYVPIQSYMLFGTIYLNLGLIYFANKGLLFWQKR
jgi:hypothetical protein